MQTVITWTKYDGTQETLPEAGKNLLLVSVYYPRSVHLASLDGPIEAPMWGGEQVFLDVEIGDLWAPWPTALVEREAKECKACCGSGVRDDGRWGGIADTTPCLECGGTGAVATPAP